MIGNHATVLQALAAEYPQLYLNPDVDDRETYRGVVLRGQEPETTSLDHYVGDCHDRLETVNTPAGEVRVVTLGNRRDFELVLRGMMAAKNGPLDKIPPDQGAAMVTVFNWPRIRAHLEKFPEKERSAEFRRFTAVKANYIDMLVVLSRGPYSGVNASAVGCSEDEWFERSDTIRRYHELTHVICRRLRPADTKPVRDELIADAVGLYAAFGRFEPELERLFLGIADGRYIGGRLGNYTNQPEKLANAVDRAIRRIAVIVNGRDRSEPFEIIETLLLQGGITLDGLS